MIIKFIYTIFLELFIFSFVCANISHTPIINVNLTNIDSNSFQLSIPKIKPPYTYAFQYPKIGVKNIRKYILNNLYIVKQHYIYPFARKFLIKEILPASGTVILAYKVKNIVVNSPSNIHFKVLGDIKTPKQINPLMKDTLWGYISSNQSGYRAEYEYDFM